MIYKVLGAIQNSDFMVNYTQIYVTFSFAYPAIVTRLQFCWQSVSENWLQGVTLAI